MPSLTRSPAWQALADHYKTVGSLPTRSLFSGDPERFQRLSISLDGLFLDLSKNRVTDATLPLLLDLARDRDVEGWRAHLFNGEPINNSEDRPALHMALRGEASDDFRIGGRPIGADIEAALGQVNTFVTGIESGARTGATGKQFTDIINIGIGGSDQGPRLACRALAPYRRRGFNTHFVANVDATDISEALHACNPETTLIIISSKTFMTLETMTNAMTARRWISDDLGSDAVAKHFAAITSVPDLAQDFGIAEDALFAIWDWVGGRYSLWSAIGLPIALGIGMKAFRELLAGARAMDQHFVSARMDANMPVLLALIGIWNRNFLGAAAHAILPYDQALEHLPAYLQQLEMESNGKAVDRDGAAVGTPTAPVVFGQTGTMGQHAFYQCLHQGTDLISADLIAAATSANPAGDHHDKLLANYLAQGAALMRGRQADPSDDDRSSVPPHQRFDGNRPVTSILLKQLDPRSLGMLLALYEHKVFVQSVIWGVNPFDQFGVELGKSMAGPLVGALARGTVLDDLDASTQGLLDRIRLFRGDAQ